jgi:hypothetical protein
MSAQNNALTKQPASAQHDQIALRAYRLWEQRGSPIGSAEEDWFRAEQEIRSETAQSAGTAGSPTAKARAASVKQS